MEFELTFRAIVTSLNIAAGVLTLFLWWNNYKDINKQRDEPKSYMLLTLSLAGMFFIRALGTVGYQLQESHVPVVLYPLPLLLLGYCIGLWITIRRRMK